MSRKDLMERVVAIAAAAGRAIVQVQNGGVLGVETKGDASPVTLADKAAHVILERELAQLLSGVPVLSEESGQTEREMLAVAMQAPRYWLVDPLDGTKDFLSGSGEYAVNVALMEDGKPVLGVVAAPVAKKVYAASLGEGAWLSAEGIAGASRLRVRSRGAGAVGPVFLISRNHAKDEAATVRDAWPAASFRAVGSSLKYCAVASAEADAHVRRGETSLWDIAAPQLVLEEAGGVILRFDGAPLAYRTGSLRNPGFVAAGDVALAREVATRFSRGAGSRP